MGRTVQTVVGLHENKRENNPGLRLEADGSMAVNALYAVLWEETVTELKLAQMPSQHRAGPDYLNVLRFLDVPEAVAMVSEKYRIILTRSRAVEWEFPLNTVRHLAVGGKLVVQP